ncbi:MAG: hypothetical protein ACYCUM_10055 [Solirubrobacteraceae bacterium]
MDTRQLIADLARLTEQRGKPVRHGLIFRVEVTSSDGGRCGVPIRVDDHPGEPRPYALNQIADSLCIERDKLLEILETRTPEQLREHLEGFTQQELKPLRLRR